MKSLYKSDGVILVNILNSIFKVFWMQLASGDHNQCHVSCILLRFIALLTLSSVKHNALFYPKILSCSFLIPKTDGPGFQIDAGIRQL